MNFARIPMIAAAALCAALIGGCGGGADLIPSANSSALDQSLGQVADATAAGDCEAAGAALADAQREFDSLPSSVNSQLRSRLASGFERLATSVPVQCQETKPKPVTTPTTSTTTTPTTTTPTTTTTTTTPTTTTTTPTTTTTTTTPTDGGGVSPNSVGGGANR
uniref:Unannotated protein n=1 Tax=freshwater metagenome TaxID=449393 RepID=A0A6J6A6J9_9ZZZZ